MKPRRQQIPITIRSDRAAARLALLTRDGRSQAQVIEEALESVPAPPTEEQQRAAFLAEIREISARSAAEPRRWESMAEFDEVTYDERGLLR
jgi:antitoxin VapB